jgi:hypothetical protein
MLPTARRLTVRKTTEIRKIRKNTNINPVSVFHRLDTKLVWNCA